MAIVVELFYSGTWQDISQYVDDRAPISITRGRHDEGTQVDPSSCTLTLNNRDGRFSPRNPTSPLYGLIGRNTPLRVTKDSARRFWGEVSAWPQSWDVSGKDVWTEIQAAGILRRLGQGQASKDATFRQWLLANTSPALYWPMTGSTALEAEMSTSGRKFFANTNSTAQINWGQGALGDYLQSGTEITTTASPGNISCLNMGLSTLSSRVCVDFVFKQTGTATFSFSFADYGTYPLDVREWDLEFRADGTNNDIQVKLTTTDFTIPSSSTSALGDTGPLTIYDGEPHHIRFQLNSVFSTDTTWTVFVDGVSVLTDIATGESVSGGIEHVSLAYIPGGSGTPLSFGHMAFYLDTPPPLANSVLAAQAFLGETAGARISRVCSDNGITFSLIGSAADTPAMGVQGASSSIVSLLQEAAATDLGILYEPLDALGLTYRTRTNLYDQAAAATLDYSAKMLAEPPSVTDDDQNVHNDVTVSNTGGGSAEAILATGALSILAPPLGINTYNTPASVNTQTDGPLGDIAAWLLHLGTIDEARFPSVHVDLFNPAVAGILAGLTGIDPGDRLVITNLPTFLPPGDVNLLAMGYSETIGQFAWDIVFNCIPASPYDVAAFSAAVAGTDRFDAENSTLAATMTTTATSVSVASAANTQIWTTVAGEFPFDVLVAGERMTVTNITGASSPQTFTVTRSVNGIVKTHASGEKVQLFKTPRFAL